MKGRLSRKLRESPRNILREAEKSVRNTGAMTTAASFHPRNRSFVIENSCTIALAASGRDLFALDLALLARVQRGTSRRYIPSSFVAGSSLTNPFK